ncbi:hypothetical protein EV175_006666, partial [Coemansia sp. RSA 1933]
MSVTKHLHTLQLVSAAVASITHEIWIMASSRSALPFLAFCVLAAAAFWRQPSRSPVLINNVESFNGAAPRFTAISKYFRRVFRVLDMQAAHSTGVVHSSTKINAAIDSTVGSGSNPDNPSSESQCTLPAAAGIDREAHMTQIQSSPPNGEMDTRDRNTTTPAIQQPSSLDDDAPDPVVDTNQPRMYRPAPIGQKTGAKHPRISSFGSDRTMALWPSPRCPEYGS